MITWVVARQTPLPMGSSRQEYWSGLPFPSPGDLPDPEIKSLSPALAGRFFITELPGKPNYIMFSSNIFGFYLLMSFYVYILSIIMIEVVV